MSPESDQKPWLIFYTLLIIDVIIILLHLRFGFRNELFNLDLERNIPTVYQSVKFVFVGIICFGAIMQMNLLKINDKATITFWSILGSAMVYLGLDEVGELHENLDKLIKFIYPNIEVIFDKYFFSRGFVSSPWILYNSLALIILSPIIAWMFYFSIKKYRIRNIYLGSTFLLFVLVIVLEYIATSWVHPWIYQSLVIAEEFAEMSGVSIISIFITKEFFTNQNKLIK